MTRIVNEQIAPVDMKQILTQDELKDKLIYLSNLFTDLKAVKVDAVRTYIFNEMFQTIGTVEKTTDQLYAAVERANRVIDKLMMLHSSQRRMHELQIQTILNQQQAEQDDKQATEDDNRAEAEMREALKRKGIHTVSESDLSKEEIDCYADWIKNQTLDTAVKEDTDTQPLTLDEICGDTKRLIDDTGITEDNDDIVNGGLSIEEFFGLDDAIQKSEDVIAESNVNQIDQKTKSKPKQKAKKTVKKSKKRISKTSESESK